MVFLNCKWTAKPHLSLFTGDFVHCSVDGLFWILMFLPCKNETNGNVFHVTPLLGVFPESQHPRPGDERPVSFASVTFSIFGCYQCLLGTWLSSVNKTLSAVQEAAVFTVLSPVFHTGYLLTAQKWFHLQTHLVPLEIGPRNGMVEWVGMKWLNYVSNTQNCLFSICWFES